MQTKNFVVVSLLIIVTVSVLTSYLGVTYLQNQMLLGPSQEGTVSFGGTIGSNVDVIIIDNSVIAGVSDTVTFPAPVTLGSTRITDTDPATSDKPYPFVVRNNGNVNARVEMSESSPGLFTSTDSRLKAWTTQASPISGVTGYSALDNCLLSNPSGGCMTGADCVSEPNADDLSCVIPKAPSALTLANSLRYEDNFDEMFVNIKVKIASNEAPGTKTTTVTIVGTQV